MNRRGPRLGIGVIRLFIARGMSLALNFVGWTLIARALGPSTYGTLQFLLALFAYVAFFADPGLSTLGTREFVTSKRPDRVVSTILGTRLFLGGLIAAGVLIVVFVAPISRDLRIILVILGSGQLALALNLGWVLRGQQHSSALASLEILSAAVFAVGAWTVVNSPGDLKSAAAVTVVGPWVAAVASTFLIGDERRQRPEFSGAAVGLLRRAFPLGVAAAAIAVYYTIDTVILGIARPADEVGWYSAAYRLVLPWLTLASVVGWLAMPRLAELVRDRPEAVHDLLRQLSHAMFLVALPLAAACSLTAPILVDTVFGDAYQSAALPLTILIWTTVTVYGNAPFGFLMLARSQDRAYMLTAIAGATVNVGLNVAIIPVFGLVGAAATSVVTEVLVFGLIVYATRDRSLDVLASSLRVAGPVAFITAVAIFPVRESLLAVPVGAAAYAGAMLMTGAVSISRIRIVLGVFRNQTS